MKSKKGRCSRRLVVGSRRNGGGGGIITFGFGTYYKEGAVMAEGEGGGGVDFTDFQVKIDS